MISENMKKKEINNIQIKPIDCNLSDNTKNYLKWVEWANKTMEVYANQLFLIW